MLFGQDIDPSKQQKPALLLRPFFALWHWLVPPTQAHMDRQSRTTVIVRSSIVGVVFIGFMVAVLVWGRDMHDYYKDWRAGQKVKEARSLIDAGNVVNAVYKAQEAYSLSPKNTAAIRLNAEMLTLMKRQEAVYYHELLEKQGKATAADTEGKVRAFMNLNRTKEASETLKKRIAGSAPTDTTFKLAEDVWRGSEQTNVLLTVMKEYCAKHPADNESMLRLARLQLGEKSASEVNEGMATLWNLAANPAEIGIKALDVIDGVPVLAPEDARRLIERLETHPRSGGRHQVSALKRRIALEPARRTAFLQRAAEKSRSLKREEKLPFVRWLVEEHEFLLVVTLVDEQEAKSYKPLLENYLTCLTLLGRLDDLTRMVEDPEVAAILNKTVQAFYRAHLAFVKGAPPDEVRQKLVTARTAAEDEGRGDVLLGVAGYSELRGFLDVAEEAFKSAARVRKTERAGYDGLVRISQLNGHEDALLSSSREAARRWPDDENLMEHYLYANLIAGKDVELSLERNLSLLAKRPDDSTVKIAAALGYFWFGDMEMATNHMQHVNLQLCTEGQRAVFAYFAAKGGFLDAAKLVVQRIPPGVKMLPMEEAFFKRTKDAIAAAAPK